MFRSIFVVIAETLCISIHTFGQGQVLETEKIICVVLLSLKYSCYGNTVFANHQKVALCNTRYDFMNEIVIQYVCTVHEIS